ncbi:MAG: hypothetical protein ACE5JX_21285, partial [Acidobacteriota bacterium]
MGTGAKRRKSRWGALFSRPSSSFPAKYLAVGGVSVLFSAGLAGLVVVGGLYFSPLLALWLAVLGITTRLRPAYGVAIFFVVASLDRAGAVFGGVFVDFSEIELAVCLLAWLASLSWGRGCSATIRAIELRPLLWGAFFAGAVAISGLVNLEVYKVLPHVLRQSEVVWAMTLAVNTFRLPRDCQPLRCGLLVAGFLYPVLGLIQVLHKEDVRAFASFTNPNQFAGYLILLVPFLAILAFRCRKQLVRLASIYALVVALLALL